MLNKYLQVALKFLNLHLTIYAKWFRIDAFLLESPAFWTRWLPQKFWASIFKQQKLEPVFLEISALLSLNHNAL